MTHNIPQLIEAGQEERIAGLEAENAALRTQLGNLPNLEKAFELRGVRICDLEDEVAALREDRPPTELALAMLNEKNERIAVLTDALAGMVRRHCTTNDAIYAVRPEDIQAVRLLAEAGMVNIERNAEYVVEGIWRDGALDKAMEAEKGSER